MSDYRRIFLLQILYLTLVQNSSYSAQAIRQRSNRMRTLWSSEAAEASSDVS